MPVTEGVPEREGVWDGVPLTLPVLVAVDVALGVRVCVCVGEGLGEGDCPPPRATSNEKRMKNSGAIAVRRVQRCKGLASQQA